MSVQRARFLGVFPHGIRRGTWSAPLLLLALSCGYVGIDLSEGDDGVDLGDGDGDEKPGDGDAGDGDTGDGDDNSGGAGDGDSGDGDGDAASGGSDGAGGSEGSGGADGTGGSDATGGAEGSGGTVGTGGTASWDPILYHDFEEGVLPGQPSPADTAELSNNTGLYHWGGHSMLAAQNEGSVATTSMGFELPDEAYQKLYLRAWLYVQNDTLVSTVDLFRFGSEAGETLDFGIGSDGRVFARTESEEEIAASSTNAFPYGTWFCFRAEAVLSDTAGVIKVNIGNNTVVSTEQIDTRPGEGITHFSYGIVATGGTNAGLAILFDDVTVDDEPIGCDMQPTMIALPAN